MAYETEFEVAWFTPDTRDCETDSELPRSFPIEAARESPGLRAVDAAWPMADANVSPTEARIDPTAWFRVEDRLTVADSVAKRAPPTCRMGDSDTDALASIPPRSWLREAPRDVAGEARTPRSWSSVLARERAELIVLDAAWFRPETSDSV
jgi:hypothetical protein